MLFNIVDMFLTIFSAHTTLPRMGSTNGLTGCRCIGIALNCTIFGQEHVFWKNGCSYEARVYVGSRHATCSRGPYLKTFITKGTIPLEATCHSRGRAVHLFTNVCNFLQGQLAHLICNATTRGLVVVVRLGTMLFTYYVGRFCDLISCFKTSAIALWCCGVVFSRVASVSFPTTRNAFYQVGQACGAPGYIRVGYLYHGDLLLFLGCQLLQLTRGVQLAAICNARGALC